MTKHPRFITYSGTSNPFRIPASNLRLDGNPKLARVVFSAFKDANDNSQHLLYVPAICKNNALCSLIDTVGAITHDITFPVEDGLSQNTGDLECYVITLAGAYASFAGTPKLTVCIEFEDQKIDPITKTGIEELNKLMQGWAPLNRLLKSERT